MDGATPWKVLPAKGERTILYRFATGEKTYTLTVTDLRSVFEETLDLDEIEKRAEKCVVNVSHSSKGDQLPVLFGHLAKALDNEESVKYDDEKDLAKVKIEHRLGGNIPLVLQWEFRPARAGNSTERLACLSLEFLEVIGSMAHRIESLQTLVLRKDYHIEGLREQLTTTGGDYAPRKFREAFGKYDESQLPPGHSARSIRSSLEVAQKYWPAELPNECAAEPSGIDGATSQKSDTTKSDDTDVDDEAKQRQEEEQRRRQLEQELAAKRATKKRKRFL